jgi:anti-anti-sigma regulatory factor
VLDLRGELDFRGEGVLLDSLAAAQQDGARSLALNFSELTALDGTGLTLILRASLWAQGAQLRLAAFGVPGGFRHLLDELGITQCLPVYHSEAWALGIPEGAEKVGGSDPWPATGWAHHLGRARPDSTPSEVPSQLVQGRRVEGPAKGFGQLWDKVYEVRLSGVETSPVQVVQLCKERLGELWPDGAELYLPPSGVVPGATGVIKLRLPGGVPLVTGIRVIHSGDTSFTFATLRGHMEAGWITFCAYQDEGITVARVESLARTGDPMFEMGFLLFGHREQERFWTRTLENLARQLGASQRVQVVKSCPDPRRRWSGVTNLPLNAAARTTFYTALGLASRLIAGSRKS